MSNRKVDTVEFDGIEISELEREAITEMIEHPDNVFEPVPHLKGVDANYLIEDGHATNWWDKL